MARKKQGGDWFLGLLLGLILVVGLAPGLFLIFALLWAIAHGASLPPWHGGG
ncbi:hypothetical protein [Kitasatospora sp. MMS16-BH015]|uniref:hypothetical protein n=1 Tax=Kitasatospora sp. MMS16-BH015 TaxID=2018025 RepID=UPI00131A5864|nr:hypothetical protein [Kitasatospora sp. MMS16-BH015]